MSAHGACFVSGYSEGVLKFNSLDDNLLTGELFTVSLNKGNIFIIDKAYEGKEFMMVRPDMSFIGFTLSLAQSAQNVSFSAAEPTEKLTDPKEVLLSRLSEPTKRRLRVLGYI